MKLDSESKKKKQPQTYLLAEKQQSETKEAEQKRAITKTAPFS
jgi:hypothetical protein